MDKYFIKKESMEIIADCIRNKTNVSETMTVEEMTAAIEEFGNDNTVPLVLRTIVEYFNNDVKSIRKFAFYSCKNLQAVSFPNCSIVNSCAFSYCSQLISVSMPNCNYIGDRAFTSCWSLPSANFTNCSIIGTECFAMCSNLLTTSFPLCKEIGSLAFNACKSLIGVDFPMVETINSQAFYNCSKLTTASFPECISIGSGTFQKCTSLTELYLLYNSVCELKHSNALSSTAIAGGTGYVYVHPYFLSSYKAATNWTYYSSRILPYQHILIDNVENVTLLFDEYKQINIPVYNANENATYNITSSDENVATVSDIISTTDSISFNINANKIEGQSVISIKASCDGYSCDAECTVDVYEEMPSYYMVEDVNGASYGFALNNNGYYESQNKGKNNSAAVCKLVFSTGGLYHLYLDCINSGESNYDFGLISNLDTKLTTDSTADSSGVFKSFKGSSSTSIQTVDIGALEAGEHFIYIKFRKDGSSNSGNDSLQFKVRME